VRKKIEEAENNHHQSCLFMVAHELHSQLKQTCDIFGCMCIITDTYTISSNHRQHNDINELSFILPRVITKMITTFNGGSSGRTVVVGVKMETNSHDSTELLTWSLVNVAQPGDLILALHVLRNDGILLTYIIIIFYFIFCFWIEF